MGNEKREAIALELIGKTFKGIECHNYYVLNDVVIIQDVLGRSKVLKLSSLSGEIELHTMDQESIDQVAIASNGKMFLFCTAKRKYLVNDQNEIVEDSEQWADSYFDELSSSFYRKDENGHWYDIDGFMMEEKVFLKSDVLISLETKTSKKSLSFRNQNLYISANRQLIQLGKVVLDLNLNVVKYYGEKITGLGAGHISFRDKDVLQEVKLGLERSAFINEYSFEPYLFREEKVIEHLGSHQYGKKRVEIFRTETMSFGLEGSSDHCLIYEGKPLQFDSPKYVRLREAELIRVSDGQKFFYFDLNKNEPYSIANLDDKILSDIDEKHVRIDKSKYFNVSGPREQFVIAEEDGKIFLLDEGSIRPEKITDSEVLNEYYGFASIDGQRKLFSKKEMAVLKFGKDALEVAEITYNTSDKLINAIDTNGNNLVLDLRFGFDNISLAETNGYKIMEIYGSPMQIGSKTLQNAYVETLGGKVRRVIDINVKSLPCFTLPENLGQVSLEDQVSLFAGNPLCEIQFLKETRLEDRVFITADFESFSGKEYPIILEKKSGTPLHLPGVAHRNELASSWVDYTRSNAFYLGENRMVGVNTISEDLKESKLLFSVQQMTSWLPFYDKYLPIFKQVAEVKDNNGIDSKKSSKLKESWEYHLFELAELSGDKEYIVVEKKAPYRLLAQKKSGEYFPRIVTSKKKAIKSPEELNALIRFFYTESTVLVEVE